LSHLIELKQCGMHFSYRYGANMQQNSIWLRVHTYNEEFNYNIYSFC